MEPLQFLREIFPFKSVVQIQNIISIVEEENPSDSSEQKMENMYNMLLGEAGPSQDSNYAAGDTLQGNNVWQDSNEGAVGYGHSDFGLNSYFNQLQSIFPDASDDFLWEFCRKRKANFDFDQSVEELTEDGYIKRETDSNTIWITLQEALPEADPTYLKNHAQRLANEDPEKLEEFVNNALENNDYPTMDEYLKNKQEDDKLKIYKQNYDLNKFLKIFLEMFPDPETHFQDPERQNPLTQAATTEDDLSYAKTFLYNRYPYIRKRHVDLVFQMKKKHLPNCCEYLDQIQKGLKTKRTEKDMPEIGNLALLQEVAYLKHRRLIKRLLKYKDDLYKQFKEEARALGLLETCGICMEDELIPEECFCCQNGCVFCKDCVRKYVEVRMGDGITNFPCCNDCESEFNLRILQLALPQNTFERLVLKIQSEEIKKANLDGLETCPFCEFASIPPEESKIFKCENPECLKESCRLCKHESHIPKRCNEIEYDEDVRRRTHIENMMTEAIARTCNKCQRKFVKSSGCNKMVCTCGAMMCYLCSQSISNYDHFGENRCQLFTNDAQIDLERVRQGAARAKQELGEGEIKFDPSVGIENFFQV